MLYDWLKLDIITLLTLYSVHAVLQMSLFLVLLRYSGASLVAQMVEISPAMQETWVWSLGQKDPLEKRMATYSSIRAWRIP